MIQAQNLSKQYGSKLLFENANAFISESSKIALIGPNGAGKSTLIKLLLGHENPDQGKIIKAQSVTFGYLAQEIPRYESGTPLTEVLRMDAKLEKLKLEKNRLEKAFEEGLEDETALINYGHILTELENWDESQLEPKAKEILMGMGFKIRDFEKPLTQFSGGWLMRVAFSRVLLQKPSLLLLDEPTNHLDLESLLWLEQFLKSYPSSMLMISHDSAFLNNLVNEVLEIDQRKIFQYKGNLHAYAEQKKLRLEHLKAQYESQRAKIEHLQEFINKNRASAAKASLAQSRVKQIEKMEIIELPPENPVMKFRFPPAPSSGKEVVKLENVTLRFGEKTLFHKIHWTLQKNKRVAIAGINGAGKTTLLRLLAGDLENFEGHIEYGHNVKIAYFAQHQSDTLSLSKTILDELHDTAPHLDLAQIRGIAGAFLFGGDAVHKKCSVLSGGEKARVALAKLLLMPANFLILDEPTNHLDADSRNVLLEALKNYTGTICLVSHDRDFIAPLVNTVLEIQPQKGGSSQVVQLLEDYEDYLQIKIQEAALQKAEGGEATLSGESKSESRRVSSLRASASSKKVSKLKATDLEQQLFDLELQKEEIELLLSENFDNPVKLKSLSEERLKILNQIKELEQALKIS